jgi:hypothetical protein
VRYCGATSTERPPKYCQVVSIAHRDALSSSRSPGSQTPPCQPSFSRFTGQSHQDVTLFFRDREWLRRVLGNHPIFAELRALCIALLFQLLSVRLCSLFFFFLPFIRFVFAGLVSHWPSSFSDGGIGSSPLGKCGINGGATFFAARLARFSSAFWRLSFSR